LRPRRKKPGYPGLRLRLRPRRCAPWLLRTPPIPCAGEKTASMPFFRLTEFALRANSNISNSRHPVGHPVIFGHGVFAARKPQELVTAGIHAGLKQRPPCRFFAFRGPAGMAGSSGLPALAGRHPQPLVWPSSLTPSADRRFQRPLWGVKSADVGRETGPRRALFPRRQGPRIFTHPEPSGESASAYIY
jgi:hypothetical protein